MLTIVIGGRRRAGMTHADYARYVQVVHGGIVRQGPGQLSSYVQNHVLDCAHGTRTAGWLPSPDYDSFSELRFADGAAFQASQDDPYFRTTIQPDELNFVTHDAIILLAAREEDEPVAHPAHGRLKIMRFLASNGSLTNDEILSAWRTETQRIACHPAIQPVLRGLRRSISLRAVDGPDLPAGFVNNAPLSPYIGVESLWFDRTDDLSGVAAYRSAIEESDSHLADLLDRRAELLFLVEEVHILPRPTHLSAWRPK